MRGKRRLISVFDSLSSMSDPTGPYAVYTRGVSYSDEFFFVDPDPVLDAALRTWRQTGEANEVLSLLQHQDSNSEYPDMVSSVHASLEGAESAVRDTLLNMIRELTFVDFGFATFGMLGGGSARWYSTEDDDDMWSSLIDQIEPEKSPDQDIVQLLAWCDRHNWPHPSLNDRAGMVAIADRAMEDCWGEMLDEDPQSFSADIVAEQLQAASRDDLMLDLWGTFAVPLVYVGPAPSVEPAVFDLRKLSLFEERGIDTSRFSATSLDPTASWKTAPTPTASPHTAEPRAKGLFSRIFGK
jgi:hypothetical protein